MKPGFLGGGGQQDGLGPFLNPPCHLWWWGLKKNEGMDSLLASPPIPLFEPTGGRKPYRPTRLDVGRNTDRLRTLLRGIVGGLRNATRNWGHCWKRRTDHAGKGVRKEGINFGCVSLGPWGRFQVSGVVNRQKVNRRGLS